MYQSLPIVFPVYALPSPPFKISQFATEDISLFQILLDETGEESCWVQIGIVSWGWGCGLSTVARDGSSRMIPGFYTNVSSVIPWIHEHVDLVQSD